ncbi:MAG: hypothetical protein PWP08_1705 [Methanofollis sp.]|nr:hypothetical protein [Methanofollis sp.]
MTYKTEYISGETGPHPKKNRGKLRTHGKPDRKNVDDNK